MKSKVLFIVLAYINAVSAAPQNFDTAIGVFETGSNSIALLDAVAVRTRFVNWPKPSSPFIVCDSTNLLMDDTQAYKYPLNCRLAALPASKVVVFLEAYGFKFSNCFMEFTQTNWNQNQQVFIFPVLNVIKTIDTTALQIYMLAYSATETYSNTTFALQVSKQSRTAVTCQIAGDPQ